MEWAEQEAALVEKRELRNVDQIIFNDSELLCLIEDRINHSPYFKYENILISSEKGNVTMFGTVSTEANKLRLRELIESMPNVNKIINMVEVHMQSA